MDRAQTDALALKWIIFPERRVMAILHWIIALGFLFPRDTTFGGSASVLINAGISTDAYAVLLIIVGLVLMFVKVPFGVAPWLFLPLLIYVVPSVLWTLEGHGARPGYPLGFISGLFISIVWLHIVTIRYDRHRKQIAILQQALEEQRRQIQSLVNDDSGAESL